MYSPSQGTQVWLCKVPLEPDNFNQIIFNNVHEQFLYFNSRSVKTFTDFTYQRQPVGDKIESIIKVDMNIEELYKCNYVAYQNSKFSGRYFYAFIKRLEYRGERVTYIHIQEDAFQNWQFELLYHSSFIERQTPYEDYKNTLADDVAHGQLICNTEYSFALSGMYFCFCSTDPFQDDVKDSEPYSFRVGNYNIPCWVLVWNETEYEDMTKTLQRISANGWGDRILSCVFVPCIPDTSKITTTTIHPSSIALDVKIALSAETEDLEKTIYLDTTFYNPRMKKCKTYPYSKIVVTDLTSGQSIELPPEKFKNDICSFDMQPIISETPYYKIIPLEYENKDKDMNHTLTVQSNASLPIANNLYAKYMMNNGEMNDLSKFTSIVGGITQMAIPTPSRIVGGVTSMIAGVGSVVAKENQASKLGNNVTPIKDGAMERICYGRNRVSIALYTMDEDHSRMAEEYWDKFGYPVRSYDYIHIPENYGERTYVKTIICNIDGLSVPQDSLQAIKDMFDHGVNLYRSSL